VFLVVNVYVWFVHVFWSVAFMCQLIVVLYGSGVLSVAVLMPLLSLFCVLFCMYCPCMVQLMGWFSGSLIVICMLFWLMGMFCELFVGVSCVMVMGRFVGVVVLVCVYV